MLGMSSASWDIGSFRLGPIWKKGKDPHPQDKIQHLDFTKGPPGRFTTRPLPVHFTTKMSVVRPFSVP